MNCAHCKNPKFGDFPFCPFCGASQVLADQSNAEDDGAVGGWEESTPRRVFRGEENHESNATNETQPNVAATHALDDGDKSNATNDTQPKEAATHDEDDQATIEETEVASASTTPDDESIETKETPPKVAAMHVPGDGEIKSLEGTSVDIHMITDLEIRGVLTQEGTGITALLKTLRNKYEKWRGIRIHIAVVGESGCGKSTLINTLRGLQSDDKGAAKIDCNECTTEPTQYPHPNNPNLVLWDLPGVGTKASPKETYLTKINFAKYDFIILLSCTRFTELDEWLAKEINNHFPKVNLFFVRSKIDSDLANLNQSRRKNPMTKQEKKAKVAEMANAARRDLTAAGIKKYYTFMINGNNPNEFEFGKLVDMFIQTVSAMKQEALVLSQIVLTNEVVEAKKTAIKKQMKDVATHAAVAAATSNRDKAEYLEVEILQKALQEYQYQLGIDKRALERIADFLNCDIEIIRTVLDSKSELFLKTLREFCKKHDTVKFSMWHLLPYFGKKIKIKEYHKQCIFVLEESFNTCICDNLKLRKIIRDRMQE